MEKVFNDATINIDMSRHDLPGVPLVDYEFHKKEEILHILFNKKIIITITGIDAITIFQIANGDKMYRNFLTDIEVKMIASECCMIEMSAMEKKTGLSNVVWARYLCFYYFRKYKGYSLAKCAMAFNHPLNHATALRGANIIENNGVTGKRFLYRNRFLRRIENIHNKIKNDR